MGSEYLSSFISNAAVDINSLILKLKSTQNFNLANMLSYSYRQQACCTFLFSGQTDIYFKSLHCGVGSYLYYLENANESEKQTSNIDPLFDAINTELWGAAELIAINSRRSCNFDCEYEDDFLYGHFLLSNFFRKHEYSDEDIERILKNYENVLDGAHDTRYLICKAFYEKDSDGFNENIVRFLVERSDSIESMIERGAMGEDEWSWARYISVEGLALLKLAELMNFDLDNKYSQIPEILRNVHQIQFDSNLWLSN